MYKSYEDREISIYKNYNTGLSYLNQKPFYKKSHSLTIKQIYEVIKAGGGVHEIQDIKPSIEFIQTHSKEEAVYRKLNLPSFTVSADFENKKSKNDAKVYTQLIGFDFDKLTTDKVNEATKQLKEWAFTLLMFKSPSGKGFKLFFKVDSTEQQHELVYRCFELYFKEKYDIEADMQCIDYTRLCFFSFDKEAYFNADSAFVTTKELINKYRNQINVSVGSDSATADIIDYTAVDTSNIKTVYYSFIHQLQKNGVDWIDGKRNQFLLELPKLKRYGITFNECLTETLTYINDRYTSEYSSNSIPKFISYNWKHYGKNLTKVAPTPTASSANTITIENYLTEKIDLVKKELLEKRILFIDAPTGSGKTTLIKQLAKELNLKTDILMPTTALVEQQKEVATMTGRKVMNTELKEANILACCYNSIIKVADRQAKLLVIDEAHSLVSDYSFKNKTIQYIQLNLDRYDYIIYLSGSILTLDNYYSEDNLLKFEKKNRFSYDYEVVTLEDKVTDTDYFVNGIEADKLNVFYMNDKNTLDKLYIFLTGKGYKVAYISKDKKENEEYKGIVESSSLEGYDVLLTTCIIQAGVNINKCDKEAVITFSKRSDLIDYIQFTARFRTTKPYVKIIHGGKLGLINLVNEDELLTRIEIEKKLLEKAKLVNESKDVDFNYLEADKIIKGYDLVFQDYEGEYIVDTFSMLYSHYLVLNKNVNSNVRILNSYLKQYNFNEVTGTALVVDEEEKKKLKKVGRNYQKEKKAKIEGVINEIFAGKHTFKQSNDKVTKEIEYRYKFLYKCLLKDSEVKKHTKLLTSKSAFDMYQARVIYMLADTEIGTNKQVADNVLLDYKRLQKLERSINVNATYSNKELKDIVEKCGYTTTTRGYIEKSLGIIYDYKPSKNNMNYYIAGKINLCDYIVSKPADLSTDIDSFFS